MKNFGGNNNVIMWPFMVQKFGKQRAKKRKLPFSTTPLASDTTSPVNLAQRPA